MQIIDVDCIGFNFNLDAMNRKHQDSIGLKERYHSIKNKTDTL